MAKKNQLAQPEETVTTVTAYEVLSNRLDALLLEAINSYHRQLANNAITPNEIKSPIIAQVRNRVKDLWAMAKAASPEEASELESKANKYVAQLPFEPEKDE